MKTEWLGMPFQPCIVKLYCIYKSYIVLNYIIYKYVDAALWYKVHLAIQSKRKTQPLDDNGVKKTVIHGYFPCGGCE